ncbi:DUF58 domain-containing protein [Saccharopolyspora cebuensis]|uniref:DUF58 domain-containing protein n=1 Tax=Saccharopolyspora cebuensis TaxID=418759 RepID=A0ABV4CNJ0_9PSEU
MLSGLTIRGRCLLAAGVAAAACSLVLDERDLLRVSVFVVALPLLALLLSASTRFGITAERRVLPDRVEVGTEAQVRLRLTGSGRLPVGGLVLEDGVPHALGGRPRFRLDALPRREGTVLEYPVLPSLRGVHHIGPLRTRIGDPFGMAEFERELADRSRLIAVPQVVELTGFPAAAGMGSGGEGTTRQRAGHGDDDAMVRQYRHGDDIRRVHWKSSARRDELMVRVEERPWHGDLTVLLDRRSAAHRGSGARSSLEWAVSAAASIALHLQRHGRTLRLVTEDAEPLASGLDQDGVLDALAAVRGSAQRDLVCTRDPGAGHELIAVLGETTPAAATELVKLRPQGSRSLAVLLDVAAWNGGEGGFDPERTARQLRAAGWTVAVARGPRTSIADVWRDLCLEHTGPEGVAS